MSGIRRGRFAASETNMSKMYPALLLWQFWSQADFKDFNFRFKSRPYEQSLFTNV
jgi:hypothetical protein